MPPKKKGDAGDATDMNFAPSANDQTRLSKMTVRNFRSIREPVTIELDDIVVLVGANNAGKSSLLRAYELVMGDGSNAGKLSIDDFPEGKIDPANLPQIELETIVFDNGPGEQWIRKENGVQVVRERWTWKAPEEKAERQGFDVHAQAWSSKVPWGAANVANSRRPRAHRIAAFDNPQKMAAEVVELLMTSVKDRVKGLQKGNPNEHTEDYHSLLKSVEELQRKLVQTEKEQIERVEDTLSRMVSEIFPDYKVQFDPKTEEDLDKVLALFNKNSATLRMGPQGGFQSPVEHQGSGAQRILMWATLRLIADSDAGPDRPHVLLLDEPENCLHPALVRDACRTLYDLADRANWQVMVTTHSPVFIDFSRKNTTIVRVEKDKRVVKGTTVFRPERVSLSDDERESLKLLNLCDPYLAEFFFGGRVVLVEGDTEYSAFKYVASTEISKYADVHVVRARGKANLCALAKILNQFGASYSILHDSDVPTAIREGKQIVNPAWTNNELIRTTVAAKPESANVRLIASLPNFEEAYLGCQTNKEKPYTAVAKMRKDRTSFEAVKQLFDFVLDEGSSGPTTCVEWGRLSIDDLAKRLSSAVPVMPVADSLPVIG